MSLIPDNLILITEIIAFGDARSRLAIACDYFELSVIK